MRSHEWKFDDVYPPQEDDFDGEDMCVDSNIRLLVKQEAKKLKRIADEDWQ